MATRYRVEFQIQRQMDDDDDFIEIGFGSSGGASSVDQAIHLASSLIANRQWETAPGMPESNEVDAD